VKTLFRVKALTATERKRASQLVSFKRNRTRLQAAQVRKLLSRFLEAKGLLHLKIFPPRDLTFSCTDQLGPYLKLYTPTGTIPSAVQTYWDLAFSCTDPLDLTFSCTDPLEPYFQLYIPTGTLPSAVQTHWDLTFSCTDLLGPCLQLYRPTGTLSSAVQTHWDLAFSCTDPLCNLLPHPFKINFIAMFPSILNTFKWNFPFRCLTKKFYMESQSVLPARLFSHLILLLFIILIFLYK